MQACVLEYYVHRQNARQSACPRSESPREADAAPPVPDQAREVFLLRLSI